MRCIVVVAVLAISMCPFALGGEGNPHITQLLDNFAAACGFPDRHSQISQIFTDSNYSGDWRRISEKDIQSCEDCYRFALTWRGQSEATLVEFDLSSESGDWTQYVMYCFDASGHLSSAISNVNTAWGWAGVRSYWVADGKVVQGPIEWRSLHTWQRIEEPTRPVEGRSFFRKVKMYRRLESLPFFKLMRNH